MTKIVDTREWLSEKFSSSLSKYLANKEINSVAVIGGSPDEPELKLICREDLQILYFGIESPGQLYDFQYLDLDLDSINTQKFDLVICNQVIEHLFNLQNAFKTIGSLVAEGGFLWITAPANNFRHGSPHFYSAGYSKEFLEKNLIEQKFEVLELGELSSKRVYFYRHLLKIWPSRFQIRFPLISYFGVPGSYLRKFLFNIQNFHIRIILVFTNYRWEIDGEHAIETFGLFRKQCT